MRHTLEGKGDTKKEHIITKPACCVTDERVSIALYSLSITLLKLVAL